MDSMATVYLHLKSALELNVMNGSKIHSLHLDLRHHCHNVNFDARVDVDTNASVTCEKA